MVNEPQITESGSENETLSVRVIRSSFDYLRNIPLAYYGLGVIVIALVAVVASGFYRVDLDETAAKRRFGQLVDAEVQPGLRWHFPFGVERVNKFKTARVHSIQVDTQILPQMSTISGDFNFVDATFVIQYKVTNLEKYLFRHANAIDILREEIRGSFVRLISNMFIYMVLVTEKKYIEDTIMDVLSDGLDSLGTGIEIVSVNMVSVTPPLDVVPAFRTVNDAKAQRREIVNSALKRSKLTLAQANGVAAKIVDETVARAEAHIEQSRSNANTFLLLLARNEVNPEQTQHTLYWNTVRKVLGNARVVVLQPGEAPNIAVNLLESPSGVPGFDDDREHEDKRRSRRLTSEDAQHPGSAAGHVMGDTPDRAPGYGGHQPGQEPHHLGNIPDNTRRLPEHVLDPNVPDSMKSEPGHLGLPHTANDSGVDLGGQDSDNDGQHATGLDDELHQATQNEQAQQQSGQLLQPEQQSQISEKEEQHPGNEGKDASRYMNQTDSLQHGSVDVNPKRGG
ncbi:MAG: protease modulator HflK [Acidiferrobacterales bacterium]|nr:protease modulator HflK [Acidiferrobacterales bacterium]